MAAESSTTADQSIFGRKEGFSINYAYSQFGPKISSGSYFMFDNYGYADVDPIFRCIKCCVPFSKIVTARPSLFLPKQVVSFLLFLERTWCKWRILHHQSSHCGRRKRTGTQPAQIHLEGFWFGGRRRCVATYSLTYLEEVFKETMFPSEGKKDIACGLKGVSAVQAQARIQVVIQCRA